LEHVVTNERKLSLLTFCYDRLAKNIGVNTWEKLRLLRLIHSNHFPFICSASFSGPNLSKPRSEPGILNQQVYEIKGNPMHYSLG